jgi:hypothetical protein
MAGRPAGALVAGGGGASGRPSPRSKINRRTAHIHQPAAGAALS